MESHPTRRRWRATAMGALLLGVVCLRTASDAYIKGIRDALDSYSGALVYTPGDNEWTDCHRLASDPKNPVERLGFLRAKFFYRP
jgi:hypothetical protein